VDTEEQEYVPPWRRQTPVLNAHLPQLRSRADKRNPALDELIERLRAEAAKRRISGHSLIR
jgi:hypothetical protein